MTPERKRQLNYVFMAMAENLATMSLASRAKVGALIVKDGNVKSTGWNGMPSGFPNDEIELHGSTNPLALHAESNAILKCAAEGSSSAGAYLYVTMSPCPDCAKLIIQAKIAKVFYRTQYRLTDGLQVLKRAKIPCIQLDEKELDDVHDRARTHARHTVGGSCTDASGRSYRPPQPSSLGGKDRARKSQVRSRKS